MKEIPHPTRRWPLLVLIAIVGLWAGVAGNQATADPTARRSWTRNGTTLIHERLPALAGQASVSHEFIYDPVSGIDLPQGFRRDGKTHTAPGGSIKPADGEAVHTAKGLSSPSASSKLDPKAVEPTALNQGGFDLRNSFTSSTKPDRSTQKEERLDYRAVFDPSVVPFKRNHALNEVARDYALKLRQGHLREVQVIGNRVEKGREVFWGSLLLDGDPDALIPLPTVSPDSQVLSYNTTPKTPLTFWKDEADNLYVKTPHSGRFRLVFVIDASTGYFGRPLPNKEKVRDIPGGLVTPLPARVNRAARRFNRELGLSRNDTVRRALETLSRYFRSFVPGISPPTSGNIYLDLARSKKGICRHRSFAFVVTALGLGIPARYVSNEAHVFVEVWVPGNNSGWMRLDLGGGADELVVHNTRDKVRHRPTGPDPFAKPPGFAGQAGQERMAGADNVRGMPATSDTTPSPDNPPESANGVAEVRLPVSKIPAPVYYPKAKPTEITLKMPNSMVYRGDRLTVSGRVQTTDGQPAQGTILILLMERTSGSKLSLLGTTSIQADGSYETHLVFPQGQALGDYDVVAQFMGNTLFAPARSR